MSEWKQANDAMRFKMAHGLWFAQMISAAREGREFDKPEPKLEDYVTIPRRTSGSGPEAAPDTPHR